jgi:hypothetical protein
VLTLGAATFISFTWNAPPELPRIRKLRTHITIYLEPLEGSRIRVTLIHDGWGVGKDWERASDLLHPCQGAGGVATLEKPLYNRTSILGNPLITRER